LREVVWGLKEQGREQPERSFMKKFVMIVLFGMAMSAFAADTAVKGYLVDVACATEEGSKPGFGAKHSKGCLQMAECVNSGYAVLTEDVKVIRFDAAGNEKVSKFLETLQKNDNIRVTVTGAVKGDEITVREIELQ
jgi:hypothetical protein